ncbi:MAG TPA: aldolase [Micromonosporaceae bacterium]|nr:aldolase [Micromonosporaceae bacterium]
MEQMTTVLARAKVVPVIRADSGTKALETAEWLLESGLTVIELTATTPDWLSALVKLRTGHPQATLGVGTVVTAANAVAALDNGADFLVSPWPAEDVRQVAQARVMPFLEGGFTPAEVAAAASRGIAKLFPAHVGGPTYLKSLLAVLPGAQIMPTGGIKLADVSSWLAAGAIAVGVGSDLDRIREVLDEL